VLRHTAATLALTAGVPVHIVAARLGDDPKTILDTWSAGFRWDRVRSTLQPSSARSAMRSASACHSPSSYVSSSVQAMVPSP
jgi:hypothetical protein